MASSKPQFVISLVALTLSIIATISSIYFSNIGMKTNVLPTLVFVYDSDKGWSVKNVGNGPALNVVVTHQDHGEKNGKILLVYTPYLKMMSSILPGLGKIRTS